jgi:hypothetical protein
MKIPKLINQSVIEMINNLNQSIIDNGKSQDISFVSEKILINTPRESDHGELEKYNFDSQDELSQVITPV